MRREPTRTRPDHRRLRRDDQQPSPTPSASRHRRARPGIEPDPDHGHDRHGRHGPSTVAAATRRTFCVAGRGVRAAERCVAASQRASSTTSTFGWAKHVVPSTAPRQLQFDSGRHRLREGSKQSRRGVIATALHRCSSETFAARAASAPKSDGKPQTRRAPAVGLTGAPGSQANLPDRGAAPLRANATKPPLRELGGRARRQIRGLSSWRGSTPSWFAMRSTTFRLGLRSPRSRSPTYVR